MAPSKRPIVNGRKSTQYVGEWDGSPGWTTRSVSGTAPEGTISSPTPRAADRSSYPVQQTSNPQTDLSGSGSPALREGSSLIPQLKLRNTRTTYADGRSEDRVGSSSDNTHDILKKKK